MKSINQFKMDHISLVLTFLGILEIAMILLLLFDIKRCGPETTAKTIITYHICPSMLGFVKSFCGISDFFLKILPFQSKFPLPHALMSCKAIYF